MTKYGFIKEGSVAGAHISTDTVTFPLVNRVEVIDNNGRSYTQYGVTSVYAMLQDDMKTLKLFVDFEKKDEISND